MSLHMSRMLRPNDFEEDIFVWDDDDPEKVEHVVADTLEPPMLFWFDGDLGRTPIHVQEWELMKRWGEPMHEMLRSWYREVAA